MQETVFVAMSGGVDSSVTAYLLKEQGYRVIGITMQVWPSGVTDPDYGGCCSLAAVEDARRVCEVIGIPHYVWNFQDVFEQGVIDYFCREYLGGRTPNPCIACNREIKFHVLLNRVRALGADFLATGHYVRTMYDERLGRWLLKKGRDEKKDQSYVLYMLRQDQLPYLKFPLGDYLKSEVRQLASRAGLPVAEKQESQEICFIPDNDYRSFLEQRLPQAAVPGPIYDVHGNLVGKHQGLAFYTIGQRHGLGLALGYPAYVVEIDPSRNALVVGEKSHLEANGLVAEKVNFIPFDTLQEERTAEVKIRYTSAPAPAVILPGRAPNEVTVRFSVPQRAVTPGQSAVFYKDDLVLGGGIISRKL
ncbi:tRNA (5-methylaminomethyl-2-thiouridylate) -methyltransferase TrmU [Thermacetogenium phaeum DSM 12270]|uniref:tRNA-specific 2-thiouridylase MnmA n=2 Tax=Thermacetogenium phaeum TaxID=85874 RepID=K4LIP3_THEPS|nr:tRNA 2-thiouridine(34) synthase MnmA [Thermacetogenium phaeum]AFV11932.1 tRNA (5-methylaminomethyl-2-thiouridylate) -methyltransferase TrmU [Thermacetogenium phaeum DSM 12270]KUK36195.1 MAG: tRNA-specific 2-thiouridylase MnmA [Thermacetogenium phaeum]MDK2881579.1 tRNA-uridine 2-sulfurtransferase [Clostridia bacterium]